MQIPNAALPHCRTAAQCLRDKSTLFLFSIYSFVFTNKICIFACKYLQKGN